MSDLEGCLESAVTLWSDAAAEKIDIAKHRETYTTALKHRTDLGQTVRDKRAMRNAMKEAFITKYAEITSRVEAEFPRDSDMQDLFFDEVRAKSALADADGDGDHAAGDDEISGDKNTG